MKILLTAATMAEIAPLINYMTARWQPKEAGVFANGNCEVHICVTGVGMIAATYMLAKVLNGTKYDMAIQAGIAGSFDRDIELGTVVCIKDDRYGDMGAEDHDKHLDIFEMGLADGNAFPFAEGRLVCPPSDFRSGLELPEVSALTVNMVSGNERTIQRLADTYKCSIESMEGAAFHYVCLCEEQPFVQVRAISNYIEPRNRAAWKIKEAVAELNDAIIFALENVVDTSVLN
jgi:futalosine hydrolase